MSSSKSAYWTTFAGIAMALVTGIGAQPSKSIEAASIKPSRATSSDSNLDSTKGRLAATNITARELIRFAFGVRDFQIEQAPKWADREQFDIVAKRADGNGNSLEDEKALVSELLADRFHLTSHRESRQTAVYLLRVTKDGPKLSAHNDAGPRTRGGCGRLVGRRVTADNIASMLAKQLDREVLNRTELAGEYDMQLNFAPDSGTCRSANDGQNGSTAIDGSGLPSIYTALQQQLGLKLESGKGAVEFLIIDHMERPSGN